LTSRVRASMPAGAIIRWPILRAEPVRTATPPRLV
jgi:hypothetical protein